MTLEQELDELLSQTLREIDAFEQQIVEKRRGLAEIKRLMREREERHAADRERQSHLTPVRPPSVSDMRATREAVEAFSNANRHSEEATNALRSSPIPKPGTTGLWSST